MCSKYNIAFIDVFQEEYFSKKATRVGKSSVYECSTVYNVGLITLLSSNKLHKPPTRSL